MMLKRPERPLQRVRDYPDFRRDENTGMIVNINKNKHAQRMKQKELDADVKTLKQEVGELKGMLNQILEKVSNA